MAPDPGGSEIRTVACNFDKLIPDEKHKSAIRDAVARTHKATILATQLLNLHARRCFEESDGVNLCIDDTFFTPNWLINAYYEVTAGTTLPKRTIPELRETRDRFMPDGFEPVDRKGLSQILMYECRNLAAVAANNVWMHFRRRILSHTRRAWKLDDAAYALLTKDEKRKRSLHLMQVAEDLTRPPTEALRAPSEHHACDMRCGLH